MQADKNDGDYDFCKSNEGQVNLLSGKHVRKKTNRKRKRTGEVTDDLDRQHERGKHHQWAQKLLDVAGTMRPQTRAMVEEKRHNS